MGDRWRLELLGGLRATRGPLAVTRFVTQKTGALLGYLAYYPEQPHARDTLAELLWPEHKATAARNNLSRALSSLRRQLEPPGVVTNVLIANRLTMQINTDAITTDVGEMRAALHAAGRASSTERVRLLEEAIALYRGGLLAGFDMDWIAAERRRLQSSAVRAARDLVAEHRRARDLKRALVHARHAVAIDPLSEEAHGDVISLLGALGETQEGLRHFEETARLLERELGVRPSPPLLELARELKNRPHARAPLPVESAPPKPTPTALPSGTVTFLALASETVELVTSHGGQVVHDAPGELVAAFGRPSDALAAALEATPSLRRALDTCEVALDQGEPRGAVLDRVRRLLHAAPPGRLLCSDATAALLLRDADVSRKLVDLGNHKLASGATSERVYLIRSRPGEDDEVRLEGAERVLGSRLPLDAHRFFGRDEELARIHEALLPRRTRLLTITGPGGIGKTRLALEAAARLADAYRGALWFVALSGLSTAEEALGAIAGVLGVEGGQTRGFVERVAAKLGEAPALLVLDGFEGLVAQGVTVVRDLLEKAPLLACLATSRRSLGLAGERELRLLGLPVPAPGATPEALAAVASTQLLVERARAVQPDFQVTPSNASAIAELIRRLEGIPLALTLAAGRVRVLAPEQILARLSSQLDLLANRRGDFPERHRTLRAAIDGSVQMLAEETRRSFAQLAVFRGSFTAEAASFVLETDALDVIAELEECSLLVAIAGQTPRFRMLDPIREYALEKLAAGEPEATSRRHADWFFSVAEGCGKALAGPEQAATLERLAADDENFRAAAQWAASERGDPALALGLASAIAPLWAIRGRFHEGVRLLESALAVARAPTGPRAAALLAAANFANRLGEFEASRTFARESLETARTLGDRAATARALVNLGNVTKTMGDYATAESLYRESAAIFEALGDERSASLALHNLALLLRDRGDLREARERFEECLALKRRLGNDASTRQTLTMLAATCLETGETDRARALADEALTSNDPRSEDARAISLLVAADIAEAIGNAAQGRLLAEQALRLYREMHDRSRTAYALVSIAAIDLAEDRTDDARELVTKGLETFRELGDKRGIAFGHIGLADVARALGDLDTAREHYEEALESLRALDARTRMPRCLEGLALVALASGELDRAAKLRDEAAALREVLGSCPTPREKIALDELARSLSRGPSKKSKPRKRR